MNGRTRFVVAGMAFLYVICWVMSLASLFGIHFWDSKYAIERIEELPGQLPEMYNSTFLIEKLSSYYTRRYIYFLPHVLGAIFWWNLYFLQLIPKVRHAYNKTFHRYLGRLLMIAAIAQAWSGVGLASRQHSNVVLILSCLLAISVVYCVYQAWKYARAHDVPRHKYWAIRLVGYLQSIALQRFFFLILALTHQFGWYGLYPDLANETSNKEEQANSIISQMFDDSFLCSGLTAFYLTEWYLAGAVGMLEAANSPNNGTNQTMKCNTMSTSATRGEKQPLISG